MKRTLCTLLVSALMVAAMPISSVVADAPPSKNAKMLEGAIRSQVNDGPVTTYEAGQSFSEMTGDRHGISANASQTKPAKLLAVFVADSNETELTIPLPN